jgi:hypothetical protein
VGWGRIPRGIPRRNALELGPVLNSEALNFDKMLRIIGNEYPIHAKGVSGNE